MEHEPDNNTCTPYALVENGNLIVRHSPGGPYPVVIPTPGVKLIVNGAECTRPTPVSSEDSVRIEAVNERIEGKWTVNVSRDGLQAIVKIIPTVLIQRELADLLPSSHLELKAAEHKNYLPPLSLEKLLNELSRANVTYGIDRDACLRAAASCKEEEIVVARGVPPEPGKDGYVELLFSTSAKELKSVKDDTLVDYRERFTYTSVSEGDILAIKHHPVPGRPGMSVKGSTIAPPEPRDSILQAGEGAALADDGNKAVATTAGRPVATTQGNSVKVSVLPELVHTGNVDLESGNITFKGDINISGNVDEGMKVEAGGNISISGLVSGARIQAGGSILIKGNVLSSSVTAGYLQAPLQVMLPHLSILTAGLQQMKAVIQQLSEDPKFKILNTALSAGPLVKLLLEGKFRYLVEAAGTFAKQLKFLSPTLLDEKLIKFGQDVEKMLITSPLSVRTIQEVDELAEKAAVWEQSLKATAVSESDVVALSIVNSTVTATGSIKITGSGSCNSRLQAGKNVTVSGAFRGGEITAGADVCLDEIGSPEGFPSRVTVAPTAKVTIKHCYESVTVSIGSQSYRFEKSQKNIQLMLDKEGNLIIRAV